VKEALQPRIGPKSHSNETASGRFDSVRSKYGGRVRVPNTVLRFGQEENSYCGDLVCDSYLSSGDGAIGIKRRNSVHTRQLCQRRTKTTGRLRSHPKRPADAPIAICLSACCRLFLTSVPRNRFGSFSAVTAPCWSGKTRCIRQAAISRSAISNLSTFMNLTMDFDVGWTCENLRKETSCAKRSWVRGRLFRLTYATFEAVRLLSLHVDASG
jgi:hypothetical protein